MQMHLKGLFVNILLFTLLILGCTVPPDQSARAPDQAAGQSTAAPVTPALTPAPDETPTAEMITPTLTPIISPSPRPTLSSEPAVRVLQEAMVDVFCMDGGTVTVNDAHYAFGCAAAAGHGSGISLRQFASAAEAEATFTTERGDRQIEAFHGCPLVSWEEPYYGGQTRVWIWQADSWLIKISATDDTPYEIAPGPAAVSENIYQAAIEQELFAACQE